MSPVPCPLSPDSGLFLHASAVVIHGGAVLFLGHSTAGKSTIARKLAERYPVLADDSVYAWPVPGDGWRVVDGGYRFEEGGLEQRDARILRQIQAQPVPLHGGCRIFKGPGIRTESLAMAAFARCLMDAVLEVDGQRMFGRKRVGVPPTGRELATSIELHRIWFRNVADIARTLPGWRLWFSRETAPSALAQTLERRLAQRAALETRQKEVVIPGREGENGVQSG